MEELMKQLTPGQIKWSKHIKEQAKSGMSQSGYCRLNDLNIKTFYSQKVKISKLKITEVNNAQSLFLPFQQASNKNEFSIKLNSGVELKFDSLPDPVWISQVISAMNAENVIS